MEDLICVLMGTKTKSHLLSSCFHVFNLICCCIQQLNELCFQIFSARPIIQLRRQNYDCFKLILGSDHLLDLYLKNRDALHHTSQPRYVFASSIAKQKFCCHLRPTPTCPPPAHSESGIHRCTQDPASSYTDGRIEAGDVFEAGRQEKQTAGFQRTQFTSELCASSTVCASTSLAPPSSSSCPPTSQDRPNCIAALPPT